MLAELVDHVVGVDPDRDWITLAVRRRGHVPASSLRVASQPPETATTTPSTFVDAHSVDSDRAWVIEGSAGYGRGLTVALERHGEWVIEFDRPTRKSKDGAKSDALDAVRAAREMLGRKRLSVPRAHDGVREAIRVHAVTRAAAVRARTGAINELKATDRHRRRAAPCPATRVTHLGQVASARSSVTTLRAVRAALHPHRHAIARPTHPAPRHRDRRSRPRAAPAARRGGAAARRRARHRLRHRSRVLRRLVPPWPLPQRSSVRSPRRHLPDDATSGQNQTRHRLNRGGDRQLNRALYHVAVTKQRCDPTTRAYIARRIADGKTEREAIRCVKRFLARRVWRLLEHPPITT